jgi:uncharacterized membrane protein
MRTRVISGEEHIAKGEFRMAENESQVYHIVAYWFEGQDRAAQVLDLVKGHAKDFGVKVQAWAVISVDQKGKTHVKETGKGGLGAGVGAGVGVVLGLLGGPAGLLLWTLGGAALGGAAGKHFGAVIPPDQLKALGAAMKPNTSAIMVLLEDMAAEKLSQTLGKEGAHVVTVTLGDQASGEVVSYGAIDLGEAAEPAEAEEPAKEE